MPNFMAKLLAIRDDIRATPMLDAHAARCREQWADQLSQLISEAHVTCHVSPIHQGEENDGPLESTDLYVHGRGVSLLVNIAIDGVITYSLGVDGERQESDTIEWEPYGG